MDHDNTDSGGTGLPVIPATQIIINQVPYPSTQRSFSLAGAQTMSVLEYPRKIGGLPELFWCYIMIEHEMAAARALRPALFAAPVARTLTWSDTDTPTGANGRARFTAEKIKYNLTGFLLYLVGVESELSCKATRQNPKCNNIWDRCIVAPPGRMRVETGGACANCFFNGDSSRCMFATNYEGSERHKADLRACGHVNMGVAMGGNETAVGDQSSDDELFVSVDNDEEMIAVDGEDEDMLDDDDDDYNDEDYEDE